MKQNMPSSKLQKIATYDPSAFSLEGSNIFGLPFTNNESEVVVIPMPWEVTVSYRTGTAEGPKTMLSVSYQIDLYNQDIPDAWKLGIGLLPISSYWQKKNNLLRPKAEKCLDHLYTGGNAADKKVKKYYDEINAAGRELNDWVYKESKKLLDQGKSVCIMGGEHSVPQGYMKAISEKYSSFSMLHIDAHADMREAFEGFEFSHASIQYNAYKNIKNIDQFVLLGIRDYSQQEADRIKNSQGKIVAFDDISLKRRAYEGATWQQLCQEVAKPLSDKVYISFDIDALDPALCPHTGTPVPGGLESEQVFYLVETLIKQGKTIIGFDICEVAPGVNDDWDSIVGARALYCLANLMAKSQGKL